MRTAKPRGKEQPPRKLPFQLRTITLTRADQDVLDRLAKDLTNYTRRTVSGSAVIRARIRHTGLQPYDWVLSQLAPLVEREIDAGVMWGQHPSEAKHAL